MDVLTVMSKSWEATLVSASVCVCVRAYVSSFEISTKNS